MNAEITETRLAPARARLLEHPLFARVSGLSELTEFMEIHVFAVWDFMSLLKSLQRAFTCVEVPWAPPANREAARLINEIVLGEESDEVAPGITMSHFELYLGAMKDCGASTEAIEKFLSRIHAGETVTDALARPEVPSPVRAFVASTLSFCTRKPHEAAAAFLYGREDVIPDMFRRILGRAGALAAPQSARLRVYLERHVEIDGGSHGPMAHRLMRALCGNDPVKWTEAAAAAAEALAARERLWNETLESLVAHDAVEQAIAK
jgi:hypothetical protein